jgi:DNA end-binding protein Ku
MSLRSIASLSLSFGLVSIPAKLYSAAESAAALRFKLMSRGGARLRQRYVADALPLAADDGAQDEATEPASVPRAAPLSVGQATSRMEPPVRTAADQPEPPASRPPLALDVDAGDEVDRHEMAKGYEYKKGEFVLFTPAELEALRAEARETIDIVAFIPIGAVDPIYYDKAYLLGPGRRGERTYSLLFHALARSQRSALAKWAWKGKEYVVQIRPADGGLVLQQLLYADEVRLPRMLDLDIVDVGDAELQLALQLIEQGARDAYDPHEFVDEEKQRILNAVQQKIAGRKTIVHHKPQPAQSADVVNLLDALRASLQPAARKNVLPPRKPVARARQKVAPATGNARRKAQGSR